MAAAPLPRPEKWFEAAIVIFIYYYNSANYKYDTSFFKYETPPSPPHFIFATHSTGGHK